MKAKWSGMGMVDGRGKINGTVGSKNRSGAYLRVKVSGVNPQTSYQLAARNTLTGLSQGWRSLTQAQRTAWNAAVGDYARTDVFGDLRNPTGKNLYTRLNINLTIAGLTNLTNPPAPSGAGSAALTSVTVVAAGAKTINFTPSPLVTGLQIWATPGVSPGKSFLKGDYRLIDFLSATDTSPVVVTTEYNARFGTPAVGSKVGFRIVPFNESTGETGIPSEATAIAS